MHSHSHFHHRRDGLLNNLANAAKGVIEEVKDHHHHDNGNEDGNGSGGRSTLDHLEVRDSNDQPGSAATLVSVVYVTASPTFTGAIAGFSTVAPPTVAAPSPSSAAPIVVPPESSAAAPSNTPQPQSSSPVAAPTTQPSVVPSSSSLLTSIKTSATDPSLPSTSTATLIPNASPTLTESNSASLAAASSSPSSGVITNNSSSTNSGMSGGAKAGIAIGVILGVLALAAGAFALYRMRKRYAEEAYVAQNAQTSEKNPFGDSAAAPPPSSRQMQSHAPILPAVGLMGASATPIHDVEKRAESPRNPFGPGAETLRDVPSSSGAAAGPSATDTEKITLGAGVAAAATAGVATATAAKRTSVPAPLKINRSQSPALVAPAMPSPAPSNNSDASLASSAMTGAAAGGASLKMHRVQMDFNPTMEDELQIRAGEIVEILHEYDDGWCLCKIVRRNKEGGSRVERGVVPRTCLSRLPLKPRNGQKRQGASTAGTSRAESPAQAPATSSGLSNAVPRSNSPALNANPVKRSVSPGPYGGGPESKAPQSPVARSRSNSMSDMKQARKEAPGPSPMSPAGAESKDITLPIQIPALDAPPAVGQAQTGSVPSSPVTRKPVPKKPE